MKRVVILQPSYLPWAGYFDQIRQADLFIFYDDVQYTRRDWRNRNRIKTAHGWSYLTVPVNKPPFTAKINEVTIQQGNWQKEHLKTLEHSYHRSPFFKDVHPLIEKMLIPTDSLAKLTIESTTTIALALELSTPCIRSSALKISAKDPSERLIALCQAVEATHYLTGPKAANYLDESLFAQAELTLEYHHYTPHIYPQPFGDFISHLSIVDQLYNRGLAL